MVQIKVKSQFLPTAHLLRLDRRPAPLSIPARDPLGPNARHKARSEKEARNEKEGEGRRERGREGGGRRAKKDPIVSRCPREVHAESIPAKLKKKTSSV